jgi:hypothetical protein
MASTTALSGSAPSGSALSSPGSAAPVAPLERIGTAAGDIWHYLHDNGPQSITKLINALDAPRDTILQALGWLAREDKIAFRGAAKSLKVLLKSG